MEAVGGAKRWRTRGARGGALGQHNKPTTSHHYSVAKQQALLSIRAGFLFAY